MWPGSEALFCPWQWQLLDHSCQYFCLPSLPVTGFHYSMCWPLGKECLLLYLWLLRAAESAYCNPLSWDLQWAPGCIHGTCLCSSPFPPLFTTICPVCGSLSCVEQVTLYWIIFVQLVVSWREETRGTSHATMLLYFSILNISAYCLLAFKFLLRSPLIILLRILVILFLLLILSFSLGLLQVLLYVVVMGLFTFILLELLGCLYSWMSSNLGIFQQSFLQIFSLPLSLSFLL